LNSLGVAHQCDRQTDVQTDKGLFSQKLCRFVVKPSAHVDRQSVYIADSDF